MTHSRISIGIAALLALCVAGVAWVLWPDSGESPTELETGAAQAAPTKPAARPAEVQDPAEPPPRARESAPAGPGDGARGEASARIQILQPDGRPAVGAEVHVFAAADADRVNRYWTMVLRRAGGAVLSDENGICSLDLDRLKSDSALILAASIEGIGHREIPIARLRETPVATLQLEAQAGLRARVTDLAGRPLAGVPVRWERDAGGYQRELATRESGADGIARFPGAQTLTADLGAHALGTQFRVEGAWVTPPLVVVTAVELAAGEVQLRVPPHGSIRIALAYADDSPLPEHFETKLRLEDPPREHHGEYWNWSQASGLAAQATDGVVLLERVEIGRLWKFAAMPVSFAEPAVFAIGGPAQAGEAVELSLRIPVNPLAYHRILVLSPEGEPIRSSSVSFSVRLQREGSSTSTSGGMMTDDEGYLGLGLPEIADPETWSLELSLRERGWTWKSEGLVQQGRHDMPTEARLQELPLLVAGTLRVAGGGELPSQLQIHLAPLVNGQAGEVLPVEDGDEDPARFRFRGDADGASALLVRARPGTIGPFVEQQVAVGQEGVDLELPAFGAFRVASAAGESWESNGVRLSFGLPGSEDAEEDTGFRSRGGPAQDPSLTRTRLYMSGTSGYGYGPVGPIYLVAHDRFGRRLHEQTFQLPPLPADQTPYTVRIPPLGVTSFRMRITDAQGQPIEGASVDWAMPNRSYRRGAHTAAGVVEFQSNATPPPMAVEAPGYLNQDVVWSGPELHVVLQPETG